MRRANFPRACAWPKLEAPSQNGTPGLIHAYAGFQAWVWNMPSHIGTSCHLLHSQGHGVCILKCSQNFLELISTQWVLWRIPMCSHGSSLPLTSLSSTMWKHNLLSRIGQVPRSMSPNFGNMKVVFHFRKPNIYNLPILDFVKIPRFNRLESYTFWWSSFEGYNQLSEIGPIHFE